MYIKCIICCNVGYGGYTHNNNKLKLCYQAASLEEPRVFSDKGSKSAAVAKLKM